MTPRSLPPKSHGHAVNFYDHDQELVDLLATYVAEGILLGDRIVVVATSAHLAALDIALRGRDTSQMVALDAQTTLDAFMVEGSPDPAAFLSTVGAVVADARRHGAPLRVFGEMVSLLWDEGNVTGAIELESLWNDLLGDLDFSLLCAYPTSSLGSARLADVGDVCASHAVVVPPASYLAGRSDPELVESTHSQVFLPVPEAVTAVRRFVAEVLDVWHERYLLPDVLLVGSELATNVVNHARSPFRVSIDRSMGVVCIAVQDVATGHAVRQTLGDEIPNGRGMAIVEALSRRWGSDDLPSGKVVWAELAAVPGRH